MFKCAALLALVAVAAAIPAYPVVDPNAAGTHWAVIVAGSNTWGNYRHQADACHAYQILIKNGYKAENIITMMYDDIAANPENPTKGVIINKPNGPDVYKGVKIDYKAEQVTPDNFVKVLTGDPSAPGPVLKSTAGDHVFINFVDHGGPGIIAFPSQLLSSSDLMKALTTMHTKNMYAKLVFYMEACESGSMFQNLLPANIDIYATTAADATHSSYACYYDQTRQTYLGDVYSVNWLEDSDLGKLATETIGQQYTIVKQKTNTSTVCEFGDVSIKSDTLNEYQGDAAASAGFRLPLLNLRAPAAPSPAADAVSSRDVDVAILRHKLAAATAPADRAAAQAALDAELAKREGGRRLFSGIVASVAGAERAEHHMTNKVSLQDYSCVEAATKHFHARCFNLGQESWALEHTMAFASMCAEGVAADAIVSAIGGACPLKANLVTAKHAEMKLIFA